MNWYQSMEAGIDSPEVVARMEALAADALRQFVHSHEVYVTANEALEKRVMHRARWMKELPPSCPNCGHELTVGLLGLPR